LVYEILYEKIINIPKIIHDILYICQK